MVLGFVDRIEDVRTFLEKAAHISTPNTKKGKVKAPKGAKLSSTEEEEDLRQKTGGIHRFRNVFAKPLEMMVDFVAPVHPKTKSQKEQLDAALSDNFIFLHLDPKSRETLVNAMEPIHVHQGQEIIQQGDLGDYFYVIEKGTVQFIVDGKLVGTGEAGTCFGELALLYDCPRAATVKCETSCDFWRVSQEVVRKIKAARAMENNKEAKACVNSVSFLKELNQDDKNRIASALEKRFFQKGDLLAKKGSPCDAFFIIQKGTVKGTDISFGDTRLDDVVFGEGEFFGQSMIKDAKPWVGNAMATTHGVAYWLSRDNFIKLLGGLELEQLIQKSRQKRVLTAIPILANTDLDPLELDLLSALIEKKEFKKGHVFCREGKVMNNPAIYTINKGTIACTKRHGGTTKTLKEMELFGFEQLLPAEGQAHVVAKHTITATENCVLGVLTLEAIVSVILDVSRLGKKTTTTVPKEEVITLESLEKYKILGAGTFGQVWLVSEQDKSNRHGILKMAQHSRPASSNKHVVPYALKIQYKRELIGFNQVEGVLHEKKIMEAIDHPFVIRLVNSYKDDLCIYMLMDLLQGGELYGIIHTDDYDGVPEDEAMFYGAGILEGLSYMHRRSIIHRDLKGENVLMDNDGYCVLIDLGFAKVIQDKTYTCCGTPIFMAPEVLLGEGHNQGADYWSLGVLIYDMIVGYTPFYVPGMTQMELYERIVRAKFKFPSDLQVSPEAKNLIRNLLFPDPSFRLGSLTRGDLDIRDHPWFKEMDFGKLFRKELEAPWVPKIKDPFDTSQFDDWSELEHKKKDLTPLTKKEQSLFDEF